MKVRHPAVAGMFYPDSREHLHQQLSTLLQGPNESESRPLRALIVPHAGYRYSGPVAASAYTRLAQDAGRYRHVVVFGPSHRVPLVGMALPSAEAFETPLGRLSLNAAVINRLMRISGMQINDDAHVQEHSVEVQLPFLQEQLGEFDLVPIVVGMTHPQKVAEAIACVWNDPETLLVFSSDLSHYQDYEHARDCDRATSAAIVAMQWPLSGDQACGSQILNGLLMFAEQHGLTIEELDLRNSGDICGDKSRVVGYGSYTIF